MATSGLNLINAGLDVQGIVDNLMYIESEPVRRMQQQTTDLKSKVSAFQSLNTKLSALLDKTNSVLFGGNTAPLLNPTAFLDRFAESIFAKGKATSSDDSIISASADKVSSTGAYSITVSGLAQAKSMASVNLADTSTTNTGTGSLTITVGNNSPMIVTIDSSNNTLAGVRNAINTANAGVTATIINDGSASPYRLLITANESGTQNSFTIADNLSGGQVLSLTEVQTAADAQFTVNGVSISKSSNTVSDVINGVTFTLKAPTTNPITLTIENDIDSIVKSLQDFVTAYNEINSFITAQFTYNYQTEKAGVLSGDSTLRRIQSQIQSKIIQSVNNNYTSYRVAEQVGLTFNRDGSLSLDETKLRSLLSNNFKEVAALLLGDGIPAGGASTSDSRVTYNGSTAATQAGTYNVDVTALAEQAFVVGNRVLTTLSQDETLTITYGGQSANPALSAGDTLATVLSKINSALSAQGMAVTAMDDGSGNLKIATDGYGSSESISVTSSLANPSGSTGFDTLPTTDNGFDIAGTINNNVAVGSGLTLTGSSGQPEEGLSLTISQTTTGSYGSVTLVDVASEGSSILLNLQSILKGITDPLSGPIYHSTDSLNQNIRMLNERIREYEERLEVRRELLISQFLKADEALKLLNIAQTSLGSQLNTLSNLD